MITPEKATRSHSFVFSNFKPLKVSVEYICGF